MISRDAFKFSLPMPPDLIKNFCHVRLVLLSIVTRARNDASHHFAVHHINFNFDATRADNGVSASLFDCTLFVVPRRACKSSL